MKLTKQHLVTLIKEVLAEGLMTPEEYEKEMRDMKPVTTPTLAAYLNPDFGMEYETAVDVGLKDPKTLRMAARASAIHGEEFPEQQLLSLFSNSKNADKMLAIARKAYKSALIKEVMETIAQSSYKAGLAAGLSDGRSLGLRYKGVPLTPDSEGNSPLRDELLAHIKNAVKDETEEYKRGYDFGFKNYWATLDTSSIMDKDN